MGVVECSGIKGCLCEDRIIFFGGFDGERFLDYLYVFSLRDNA